MQMDSNKDQDCCLALKNHYRQEIYKLRERIALLESELHVRKKLEERNVVESRSSCYNDDRPVTAQKDFSATHNNTTLKSIAPEALHLSAKPSDNWNATSNSDLIEMEQFCNLDANPIASDIFGNNPLCHDSNSREGPGVKIPIPNEKQSIASQLKLSPLTKDQVERYSRHLLLSEGFGVTGQLKLLESSVLVIGAGGIGSTVLLYLAATGVGTIGVVDFDCVESTNLHRQIIHSSTAVGMNKATSAVMRMKELNPTVNFIAIQEAFTYRNALSLVSSYDCIVDATDNTLTRYLINDACVLSNKPLVSGSSMGVEGQLTVHNYLGGPCYRCLYPKPLASEACKSCSDDGVLGPVPGMIGILQAIEVIKILTQTGSTMHDTVLMYDALQCCFLRIKKTGKKHTCGVCGHDPWIKCMEDSVQASIGESSHAVKAVSQLEGFLSPRKNHSSNHAIPTVSCADYFKLASTKEHVLLDVRVAQQYAMIRLKDSVNIPVENLHAMLPKVELLSGGTKEVYCICRRGIASLEATRIIMDAIASGQYPNIHSVRNIDGGLVAWSREVDTDFPIY